MAAPGVWTFYNETLLLLGEKAINLDTDVLKMALFTSASNVGGAGLSPAQYGAATGELANGHGYATGGQALTTAWTGDSTQATKTLGSSDASWSASGADLVFRYAVIYDDTATDKPLLCYCLMDSAPADFTIPDGKTRAVEIAVTGVMTLAQQF
jgi:hypothetical protein